MNDRFVMRCPKCSSIGLERFSDRATSWGGLDTFALKCRTCGKVMYGEDACQEEYDRQKKAWQKDRPERERAAREEAARARAEAERQRQIDEHQRRAAAEAARRAEQERREREEANRRWAEQKAAERATDKKQSDNREDLDDTTCAWHECDKPSRPRSIYCSRACSNKNARWRHKLRKQGKDPDAVAA